MAVSADGKPRVQTGAPSCRSMGGLKTDTVGGIFLLNAYDYMTSIFLPLRQKKKKKKREKKGKKAARPVIFSSVVIIVYDWVAASGRTARSFAVGPNSNFATSKTIYCLARDVIVLSCWQTRGLEMSRVMSDQRLVLRVNLVCITRVNLKLN